MTEEANSRKKLQWHSAFYAEIQIELAEDADKLIFENEHQLGTKPMEIDVLIIKKQKDEPISKNIGRIFRGHNIIEYKSPEDYLSIDDFYKVMGYACFYKSDVQNVDAIRAEEITITFVCKGYPRKLVEHLKTARELVLTEYAEGIYYIHGGMFPMQLVVTSEVSKEENFWLKHLTNGINTKEDAEEVVEKYRKHKNSRLHKSVMDIIVRANEERFKEVRGNMCDALVELMQDVLDERAEKMAEKMAEERAEKLAEERAEKLAEERAEKMAEEMAEKIVEKRTEQARYLGKMEGLHELIQKKLAKGKAVEQIAEELEETEEHIRSLMAFI